MNHRTPIIVVYLRGHGYRYTSVLASLRIENESPNIPMQVNLAVTGASDSARVTWFTRDYAPGE